MRTIDFTPFSRSTIGFDHLFNLLNAQTAENAENYPPTILFEPAKIRSASIWLWPDSRLRISI